MALLLLCMACRSNDPDVDTVAGVDSTPSDQPFWAIEEAMARCVEGAWQVEFFASIWLHRGSDVVLNMANTTADPSARLESHLFPETELHPGGDQDTRGTRGAGGEWEHPYMELAVVPSEDDFVHSETSLFDCEQQEQMTFSVIVYLGDQIGFDIVSWGHDPTFVHEDWDFSRGRPL